MADSYSSNAKVRHLYCSSGSPLACFIHQSSHALLVVVLPWLLLMQLQYRIPYFLSQGRLPSICGSPCAAVVSHGTRRRQHATDHEIDSSVSRCRCTLSLFFCERPLRLYYYRPQ